MLQYITACHKRKRSYHASPCCKQGTGESCYTLAYAIGKAEPVAVDADTHDTGIYADSILKEAATSVFDLTPSGIIRTLGLTRPIFALTACYGHFTDDSFPWEQINRAHELRIVCNAIESEKKHDQR